MYSMKEEKAQKSSIRKNIPFYISLAVCLAAVLGAAWTTYGNIEEYMDAPEEISEQSEEQKVNEEVSGQSYSRPEKPVQESKPQTKKENSDTKESSSQENTKNPDTADAKPVVTENTAPKAVLPIDSGDIVKPFSIKKPLRSVTMNDWRTHSGIDISAGSGSPVRAVLNGKVASVYKDAMLGNVVKIEHEGGYTALYCGVTDTTVVHEGDTVAAGDTIAYVGKIPSEVLDKEHLHLEMTLNGDMIDPEALL